uniref:Reverse transcriptase domain-containing protein n=1 Tax=Caenorhabditis japonica TaxID=281687 RepID=A0A8R1I7B7_CAEJA
MEFFAQRQRQLHATLTQTLHSSRVVRDSKLRKVRVKVAVTLRLSCGFLLRKASQDDSSKKKDTTDKSKQKIKTAAVAHVESDAVQVTPVEEAEVENPIASTIAKKGRDAVFIPTLRTTAFNPESKQWEEISIMLDSGADQSYVTFSLANRWNLPPKGHETFLLRTFGSEEAEMKTYGKTNICITAGAKNVELDVLVTANLAGKVRKAQLSEEDMQFVTENNLVINDDSKEEMIYPDIILGCDYLGEIETGKKVRLPSGLDIIGTHMGYTTMGKKIQSDPEEKVQYLMAALTDDTCNGQDIEEKQKKETQMKIQDTVEKRTDGYYVQLPYKDHQPYLPDNYSLAFKRLQSVHRNSSREVLEKIRDVFEDQIKKGIIEEVDPRVVTEHRIHYNPHQPVLTPLKTTTKCRVVIDGSSHYKGKPSLNDVIHQGPVILPDIVQMLTRFRSGRHVIIADVEKAFLQVFLHEKDRDVTRVIWIRDLDQPLTDENLVIYRFTRVLFGLNVSPFLLAATIQYHLESYPDQALATEMNNNLYVDNLLLTTDGDIDLMMEIYQQTKHALRGMNMNLRQYLSNQKEFRGRIKEEDRADEEDIKVLGIMYESGSDQLIMKM